MVDECGEIVVARVCGDLVGREAVLGDCVQVTASSAETAHDLSVAVLGSKMQWSGSVLHVHYVWTMLHTYMYKCVAKEAE